MQRAGPRPGRREGSRSGDSRRRGLLGGSDRATRAAEPEGLILPFTIIPVEALVERYPRHRTGDAAFLSTIFDVRAGESAKPYSELDVHGRAEAVARARELALLAPSDRRR